MHWISTLFYMEAKFGPLERRIKTIDVIRDEIFSEEPLDTNFLTTNVTEEFWQS
jgi:hypothetical protein